MVGRTIPSFRLAHIAEESQWRLFRNYLDRSDRKEFDRMFSIARLYISACSYAATNRPVRIQPIMVSILFHHYKQLVTIARRAGIEMPTYDDTGNKP